MVMGVTVPNAYTQALLNRAASNYALPQYPAFYDGVEFRNAAIALEFDDAPALDFSQTYPDIQARFLVAGFAVPKNYLSDYGGGGAGGGLSVAQCLTMQNNGMEILCHSRSHNTNVNTNANQGATFIDETATVTAELRAVGLACRSFQQPGTWTGIWNFDSFSKYSGQANQWIGDLLQDNFASFHAFTPFQNVQGGALGGVPLPIQERYAPLVHITGDTSTLAALEAAVDAIVQYGGGLKVLSHSYNFGTGGHISLADFRTFLSYVQTWRDRGFLDVLTPTGLLYARRNPAGPRNLLFDGGFELQPGGGVWYGWRISGGAPILVTTGGHTGANFVQISSANTLDHAFNGLSGGSYRLEFWAQSSSAVGVLDAKMLVYTEDERTGTFYANPVSADYTTVNGAWTKFIFHFGLHPLATLALIRLQARGAGTPDQYYDDIALYAV